MPTSGTCFRVSSADTVAGLSEAAAPCSSTSGGPWLQAQCPLSDLSMAAPSSAASELVAKELVQRISVLYSVYPGLENFLPTSVHLVPSAFYAAEFPTIDGSPAGLALVSNTAMYHLLF